MNEEEKKLAAEARNAYAREWRAKNPDKLLSEKDELKRLRQEVDYLKQEIEFLKKISSIKTTRK